MSPLQFNIYSEYIFGESLLRYEDGNPLESEMDKLHAICRWQSFLQIVKKVCGNLPTEYK